MNRRVRLCFALALGSALCWRTAGGGASVARGQNLAPAAGTGPSIPLAVQAASNPQLSVVQAFITSQMTQLASPNPAVQQPARTALVNNCPRVGTSAAYQQMYAGQLSQAALPLLTPGSSPVSVRVNVGYVLATVVANAPVVQAEPAVLKLLADPSEGVALWGVKAAKPLVTTEVLNAGPTAKLSLPAAVVSAVKAHANGGFAGFIASDAYRALAVDPNGVPGQPGPQVQAKLGPLTDPVLDLFQFRTSLYRNGIVPVPDAEAVVPTFLYRNYSGGGLGRSLMTQAQQNRTIQALVDFVVEAGQRAPAGDRPQLTALGKSLSQAAGALDVLGGVTSLYKLAHLAPGETGANIANLSSTAFHDMQLKFSNLKPPPTLPPLPAAPAGTSTSGATASGRP